ncbi:MAG: hypothetical protein ACXWT0_00450 [Methylobacter sp.]
MVYDKENDRIIEADDDAEIMIYPTGLSFDKSEGISIQTESADECITIPAGKIRALIDGLTQAATRIGA